MDHFDALVMYFQAHIETIQKFFKKTYFFRTSIRRQPRSSSDGTAIWGLHDICDTMRYKDVADRLAAALAHVVDADAALGTGSMVVDMPLVPQ